MSNLPNSNDKWKYLYEGLSKDLRDFSEELERRKYNKRVMAVAGIGIFGFASYGLFRNWASKEVVLISSKTFDDEQFQKKSFSYSKQIIKELTESEEVQRDLTNLLEKSVINLLKRETVQNQFIDLVSTAVESNKVTEATKQTLTVIMQDEKIIKETSTYLSVSIWGMFKRKK